MSAVRSARTRYTTAVCCRPQMTTEGKGRCVLHAARNRNVKITRECKEQEVTRNNDFCQDECDANRPIPPQRKRRVHHENRLIITLLNSPNSRHECVGHDTAQHFSHMHTQVASWFFLITGVLWLLLINCAFDKTSSSSYRLRLLLMQPNMRHTRARLSTLLIQLRRKVIALHFMHI